jgi:hypothetical protein
MDSKYVIQAFDLRLKGRFDVLLKYYGNELFELPATIVVTRIKDQLGIFISEQSIYTFKKRLKNQRPAFVERSLDLVPLDTGVHSRQLANLSYSINWHSSLLK